MKKIAVIGGGTGSYTVLTGLKDYAVELTAIPSMFDSGGHSGELRVEEGVLPPGDARRCLAALAHDASDLREIFNYRYKDVSVGNLFIAALQKKYGCDAKAIERAGEILNIQGRVLPVSKNDSHLCALLENGEEIYGETEIDRPKKSLRSPIKQVRLDPPAFIYRETYEAIIDADMIVLGPGDLYTSIIPNLLVKGVPEAIQASDATRVYICNLMTKDGETNGFNASDHASRIADLVGLDYIVCNSTIPEKNRLKEYATEHAVPVVIDKALSRYATTIVQADVMSDASLVRHDSDKLARLLLSL